MRQHPPLLQSFPTLEKPVFHCPPTTWALKQWQCCQRKGNWREDPLPRRNECCTRTPFTPQLGSQPLAFALVLTERTKSSIQVSSHKSTEQGIRSISMVSCPYFPAIGNLAILWGRSGRLPLRYSIYSTPGKAIKSLKGTRAVYPTFLAICCPINMISSWENTALPVRDESTPPNWETKGERQSCLWSYCKQMHFKRNCGDRFCFTVFVLRPTMTGSLWGPFLHFCQGFQSWSSAVRWNARCRNILA